MFHWLTVVILSFSSIARAEFDCRLLQRADFEEPIQAIQDLRQPIVFLGAALRFSVVGEEDQFLSGCSGAFVSDGGDILTGSHCLDACRFESDGSLKGGARICRIQIDRKIHEVEVVKAASCPTVKKINYLVRQKKGLSTEFSPQNCKDGGFDDAAIIRPLHPEKLKPFTCLDLADEKVPLGRSVFTMAFPNNTHRAATVPGAKDATRNDLVLSKGETVERPYCERRGVSARQTPLSEGAEVMRPYMIQTTVDAVSGSSGGPLISEEGKIVGVASFVDSQQNEATECRGASFFQPVTGLKKELGTALGSCKRRDANRARSI